jgi:probable F420-dependent oxidoreductase
MKFGLAMFGVSPRHYVEVARSAEEVGFESIWVPEHLVLPTTMSPAYPYSVDGLPPVTSTTPMFDPWVLLGAVAATTTALRLATYVYILPLRHPFVTARSLVTLDRVSGGRVTLGAGAGWLPEEFSAAGQSFGDRGRRMEETIPLLRRLWSEPAVEHHGEFFDFEPVAFEPKPLQRPSIPIELGGHSRPALRRAGRLGDGWIEVGSGDAETFAARLRVVLEARAESGHDRAPFEVSTGLATDVDRVHRYEDLGATRAIVGPPTAARRDTDRTRLDKDDVVAWCHWFAETVMARAG